jgi:hypothetical protein
MKLHTLTEFTTEWFSIYPRINSTFGTIAIFKSFAKENNDSDKT